MIRVLVVDDEPAVLRALRRMLKRRGFEVEIASVGREALDRLEAFSPQVVVSDHWMPEMTGLELISEVRKRLPSAACLILSAWSFLTSSGELTAPADCPVMAKPWDDDVLVATIHRLVAEKRAEGSPKADG